MIDRAHFLKLLAVTPAALSPAAALASAGAGHAMLSDGDARFVVEDSPLGPRYRTFVKDGTSWRPASLAANAFVAGSSIDVRASSIVATAGTIDVRGTGRGRGTDGRRVSYPWSSRVTVHPSGGFWIDMTLAAPQPLLLDQHAGIQPQIVLWLAENSTLMEGQSTSWRRVLHDQPTRNSLGAQGNDMPSVYLLDQNNGVETIMYFDMSAMGWMSTRNVPRFLAYRCSTVTQLTGKDRQRFGLGLVASQASGNVLPAGPIHFSYWIKQRRTLDFLDERHTVDRWLSAVLPLFVENLTWPSCATTWADAAAGATADLKVNDAATITVRGHTGLRAYVKDSSALWGNQESTGFELMALSDVLWPLTLYAKLHPAAATDTQIDALLASMPAFHDAAAHTLQNTINFGVDDIADSWYPFENALIKFPTIAMIAHRPALGDLFVEAYASARKLAQRYDNLFPIYYGTQSLDQRGAGTNYAVNGLFAWSGIVAHRLTGKDAYLDDARHALDVLVHVRAAEIFHEPQELAFGALAAAELGMPDVARYLIQEQLRMFYWYTDPAEPRHDTRGMVQAAASILYPAFKENVEAIMPWTGVLKRGIVIPETLKFMDQQRRNNFAFFERCAEPKKDAKLPSIPLENLAMLELGDHTGDVGQEIYGSGEVLWMYLMFEALGRAKDRELMLVNLDLLDVTSRERFPAAERNFVLFNPTPQSRAVAIEAPGFPNAVVHALVGGELRAVPPTIAPLEIVTLKMHV